MMVLNNIIIIINSIIIIIIIIFVSSWTLSALEVAVVAASRITTDYGHY